MRSYHISIYYTDKPELLKDPDSSPKRSLATPWIRGNHGLFWIDVAIVSPKPQEPENDFPLSGAEFHAISQAISDLVILLEEKLR